MDPIDNLHAECVTAMHSIRATFTKVKAEASIWEPRPCPIPNTDTPYLDEIERSRPWLRSLR